MVNLNDKLRLVLDTSKTDEKINESVIEIERKEKVPFSYSIFFMVGDAFDKKAKVYRINKKIRTSRKIYGFKFLEK